MRPFAVTHYFGQRTRGARVLYKNDEARMTNDERMTKIRMTKRSIRVAPAAWTRRPRRALARTRKRRGRRFYFVAPIAFGASTKKKRPPWRGALRLRQIEPIDAYAPPHQSKRTQANQAWSSRFWDGTGDCNVIQLPVGRKADSHCVRQHTL